MFSYASDKIMSEWFLDLKGIDFQNRRRTVTDACSSVTMVRYQTTNRSCEETMRASKIVCLVPEHNSDRKFLKVPGKEGQFITQDLREHVIVFYSDTAALKWHDVQPLQNIQTVSAHASVHMCACVGPLYN
jgi:hypothetical protein